MTATSQERNVPTRVFVDTVFLIALVNRKDRYHEQAGELADEFDGYPLLVTDAVLLEIGNAMARGFRDEAVEIIEDFLTSREAQVVRLTPPLFDQAFALYRTHRDKEWSLVD
jgi:predicted nucleic acid-binding protein